MIYNKPHDISWKRLPSLRFSDNKKQNAKASSKTDNLINQGKKQGASAPITSINTPYVIDINDMPLIEGVPILQFPPKPTQEDSITNKKRTSEPPPYREKKAKHVKEKKAKPKQTVKVQQISKAQLLKIASFFITLYIGTVFAFIIPLRPAYSESEKRDLAKFPNFTFETFVSGDYFSNIDTWFSDTFPHRDFFTSLDSKFKELYGINDVKIHGNFTEGDDIPDAPVTEPENTEAESTTAAPPETEAPTTEPQKRPDIAMQDLGAVIVAGDTGYEYYGFSSELGARYVAGVNTIKDKAKPVNNVYSLVVPTSIDVTLNDVLRSEVNSSDQKKALKFFNSSITNAVPVTTLLDTERQHRDEYIYFRTDHHWTALGAYYAYADFCKTKGIEPVTLSKYEEITFENFTGTFYTNASQNSTLKENADSVIAYKPLYKNTCTITKADGVSYELDLVRDVTDFGSTLKYLTFMGGDNPLTTIKNLDKPREEVCVVIKDSYGNAFVPFLLPHYSTIYVIDPRYYTGSLEEFCSDKVINDVIFVSNISTTRNKIFIEALENLVR